MGQPGVVVDTVPAGKAFGDLAADRAKDSYSVGETVNASFYGANLRNDYLHGLSRTIIVNKDGFYLLRLTKHRQQLHDGRPQRGICLGLGDG